MRARAILVQQFKWVNGTTLRYWFFSGPASQKQAMRRAFKVWQDVGIGLRFEETSRRDDAQIRIAFEDDGSWSYLGRQILQIAKSEPTMNIGWDITQDLDTGIHEIGHTLGMPHEHQNPNSGIVWDEEAVYASLARPPNNWDRQKTHWNILRKLETAEITGSDWDPNSIMHYPFGGGLIIKPERYQAGLQPAGGLSRHDKKWVKKFYPPLKANLAVLKPFQATRVSAKTGGFENFAFSPEETRTYMFKTFGNVDAVMVLFEGDHNNQQYLFGADDSGQESNAEIAMRLSASKQYTLAVRVLYREPDSDAAIMVW